MGFQDVDPTLGPGLYCNGLDMGNACLITTCEIHRHSEVFRISQTEEAKGVQIGSRGPDAVLNGLVH